METTSSVPQIENRMQFGKCVWKLLLTVTAGVILILWVGIAALWIRSYWRGDCVFTDKPGQPEKAWDTYTLISGRGGICLAHRHWVINAEQRAQTEWPQWMTFAKPAYPEPAMWQRLMGVWVYSGAGSLRGIGSLTVRGSGSWIPTTQFTPAITANQPVSITNNSTVTFRTALASPAPTTLPAAMIGVFEQPPTPLTGSSQFLFYRAAPWGPRDFTRVAIIPYWALLAAMSIPAILPVAMILQYRRRRRRMREGCCRRCGYDLRATPDRCPECGLVPNEVAPSSTGSQAI